MTRKLISGFWLPALVVLLAGLQMWAADAARLSGLDNEGPKEEMSEAPDTVIYNNKKIYTKFRKNGSTAMRDSLEGVIPEEVDDTTPVILARDTIKVPDSLKLTDPFRYEWYIPLVDSLTHKQVVDSLRNAGDTLIWKRIDSIYYADSTAAAKLKFQLWYNGLSKEDRKRYDDEQKLRRQQKILDSLFVVKDSIQHVKDSIRENTPRILETFALPDSLWYKRIVKWTRDPLFSNVEVQKYDTTANYWFNDYHFQREDVGATYLGTIGGAYQNYDFFKRNSVNGVSFYTPYEGYSMSPSTTPMYNTKTPYTELAYWGNLFSNVEREEASIHILVSQNIHPELNISLVYDRFGTNGMLDNEKVDNRTIGAWMNYTGKKYLAHGGAFINTIKKNENGGLTDSFWIRDTTVGVREIPVNLEDARNKIKKTTLFLDQQYRIPLPFLAKIFGGQQVDSLASDLTTAFIGHSSELSNFSKIYTDKLTKDSEKAYYKDIFYINPSESNDSLHVSKFENKVFMKLQPWSRDAVISTLDVGLGNRIQKFYMQDSLSFIHKRVNTTWNSTYLYGGAGGRWNGFEWKANAYVTMIGDESGDSGIKASADYAFYPFRKAKHSPVNIHLGFESTLKKPDYYQLHYFGNHDKWNNDFKKISITKFEGSIDVPYWDLRASAGYSLLDGNIWYDSLGVVKQNTSPMHVAKLAVEKNFKFWKFHLDNRALFQVTSDKESLPLPPIVVNSRFYMQFKVGGDAMTMQLGANVNWNKGWYAPSYRPSTGVFTHQDKEKIGDCPYIDAFVNMQWKKACIFLKMVNIGEGWPNEKPDYFSAKGYIRPRSSLKFGIWVPFYTSHRKNHTLSSRASSGM